LFEQLDRPALQSLPPRPYEYADWKRCRVNLDYHIEIAKHFYSVPFRLLRQEVEARITAKTVEIYHRGNLVATHLRSLRPYRPTTVVEHMPSSHQRYRDWTDERIRAKPLRSATMPQRWSRSSCVRARIPNRGSAPASAFSDCASATAQSGWTPPVPRRSSWAPAPTAPSLRS
jgi:hypothetical protein